MKLCNKSSMIKERLFDIAYLNNLDSNDLLESIKMIVKKNLELELLVEFNFMISTDELIEILNRVSVRNHLQRRYEIIVNSELADCKN
jgi:hypothetical protein